MHKQAHYSTWTLPFLLYSSIPKHCSQFMPSELKNCTVDRGMDKKNIWPQKRDIITCNAQPKVASKWHRQQMVWILDFDCTYFSHIYTKRLWLLHCHAWRATCAPEMKWFWLNVSQSNLQWTPYGKKRQQVQKITWKCAHNSPTERTATISNGEKKIKFDLHLRDTHIVKA